MTLVDEPPCVSRQRLRTHDRLVIFGKHATGHTNAKHLKSERKQPWHIGCFKGRGNLRASWLPLGYAPIDGSVLIFSYPLLLTLIPTTYVGRFFLLT